MIEVHHERGEWKIVQLDKRGQDTFITTMYCEDDEISHLMEQIDDIQWGRYVK